ncbi:MATE family efflux transporter [Faecalimonas sp.]
MRTEVLKKQLFQYILPSMLAMLLSGFYAIVDGLFVGNAAGDAALGAINLVWPLQCVLNATAVGLGVGSAVLMSTYLGSEKYEEAKRTCLLGIVLLFIAGAVLSLVLLFFLPQLLSFLGASGELAYLCRQYIVIILCGGIFPVIGNGLNPLIRNQGNTVSATVLMSTGLITNIVLDYYLVFRWEMGLRGAGLATIFAQAVVACCSLVFLWKKQGELFCKENLQFRFSEVKKIIHIGVSPFGQVVVPSLVILFTNWKCIIYGGNTAVTIFSVVSYVLSTIQLLLQGIGDGVQPLFSFYYGGKKEKEVSWLYRHAFWISVVASIFFTVIVYVYAGELAKLFGIQEGLREPCVEAIRFTSFAFGTLGIARLTCSYFYATGNHIISTILVYIEPCLLLPLFLQILTMTFKMTGVWMAYPLVQLLLCVATMVIKYRMEKEK